MYSTRASIILSVVLIAGCASLGGPTKLDQDTEFKTPGGSSFKAAAGWTAEVRPDHVRLDSPEQDFTMAVVDVTGADVNAAVAAAWGAVDFGTEYPIFKVTERPALDGWDEVQSVSYEVPPNAKRSKAAHLSRAGAGWTAIIFEGNLATLQKRFSQVLVPYDTLKPAGYQKETFAGRKAATLDAERLAALKAFVADSMQQLGVPGVGLSIWQGGKPVFEGGLGVRKLGGSAKVNADTKFLIASNTKGMATLLLAKLVEQGKLSWDDRAVDVYPAFRLGDDETTAKVLIRHLICACTGLPRQDLEWIFEFKDADAGDSMQLLAGMQPTSGFGELFQYSNLMAAAAGYIGGYVLYPEMELGAAFDRAMQEHVFGPLGMDRTTFDFARAVKGNYARPHSADIDNKTRAVAMDMNHAIVPVRPAGGAWSTPRDVMRYVQMELRKGLLPDGTRYIAEGPLLERRQPFVRIGEHESYGMGLSMDNEWGVPTVLHGGSMLGYKSNFVFLPEHDVAAVVLTNDDDGYDISSSFQRRLLEVLFDGEPRAVKQVADAAKSNREWRETLRPKLSIPPAKEVLAGLAASYHNDALGSLAFKRAGKETILSTDEWQGPIATRKNDDGTVSIVYLGPEALGQPLVIGEDDGKRTLTIRTAQQEYVFVEVEE